MEILLVLLLVSILIAIASLPSLLLWWLAWKFLPRAYTLPPLRMTALCSSLNLLKIPNTRHLPVRGKRLLNAMLKSVAEAGGFYDNQDYPPMDKATFEQVKTAARAGSLPP